MSLMISAVLTADWLLQYSMWLDQHSMEEALKFIRSALEACAAVAEKEPGFSEVYPFMLQLSKGAAH